MESFLLRTLLLRVFTNKPLPLTNRNQKEPSIKENKISRCSFVGRTYSDFLCSSFDYCYLYVLHYPRLCHFRRFHCLECNKGRWNGTEKSLSKDRIHNRGRKKQNPSPPVRGISPLRKCIPQGSMLLLRSK